MARRLWRPGPVPAVPAGGWQSTGRILVPMRRPVVRGLGSYRPVQTYIGGYGVGSATVGGQVASATGSSLTTLTVPFTRATLGGGCLAAVVGSEGATDSPTVSGIVLEPSGSADNWQSAVSAYAGTNMPMAAIWIDPASKAGQTSAVITLTGGSGAAGVCAYVFEVPGTGSSPLDQAVGVTSGATEAPVLLKSGALASSPELAIGVTVVPSNVTLTGPASGWAVQPQLTGGTSTNLLCGFQAVSSTSPVAWSGSSAAAEYAACLITLKGLSLATPMLGQAVVTLGPSGLGCQWYPNQVNIATALGAADPATCAGYLNIVGQGGFLFQSYAGGGDQVGLAVPEILPGELLYFVWSGSTPGIGAQAVILGSQTVLA